MHLNPSPDIETVSKRYQSSLLAGKAVLTYRRRDGTKTYVLPGFYISAHAAVSKLTLLTRDTARYKTACPTLTLISPNNC